MSVARAAAGPAVEELVEGFVARLRADLARRHPLRLVITVVTEVGAHTARVEVGRGGCRFHDELTPTDIELIFEFAEDLAAIERGERSLMGVLRTGRASVRAPELADARFLLAMTPAPGDPDPDPDLVVELPVWIEGRSSRAIAKRVREIGVERLLRSYCRVQAEAIVGAGLHRTLPPFTFAFSAGAGSQVACFAARTTVEGADVVELAPEKADVLVAWADPVDFARYVARQLDFRDAILQGRCRLSGDRDLAVNVHAQVGRHGL